MKRFLGLICSLTIVFSLGTIVLPPTVLADMYVSGSFNSWGTDNMMLDLGAGNYASLLTIESQGRYEFKVRNDDWSLSYPASGNSWFYTDQPDQMVEIQLRPGAVYDGAYPIENLMYVIVYGSNPLSWTAVGDWQAWNNTNPETAMTTLVGGGFSLTTVIETPGDYQYKAVVTGTWDGIGADGRSTNPVSVPFQTTQIGQEVTFYVFPIEGRVRIDVASVPEPVPEPATMLLFSSGLIGLAGYGRKKFFKR